MKSTAALLLAFVSAIFVAKYSVRLGAPGILSGLLSGIFFLTLAIAAPGFARRFRAPLTGRFILLVTGGLSILALIGILLLSPESRVGRLPAIDVWLSDFLGGTFPYHAPNQPSGFPMLFIMALPAYLLGNTGLLEVAGIALFGAALWKMNKEGTAGGWVPIALLLLLPSFYYEVIVRSELFFNMTLVLALILFSDEYTARRDSIRKFPGIAILFGLALSTRAIVGLVYVVYVLWRFRREPLRGAAFAAVAVGTFFLTLLPFVLWNPGLFLSNGPFTIQFGYLPFWIILGVLGAAAVAGLLVRERREVLFSIGVLLFVVVFIAFCLKVLESDVSATLSIDRFDISYFVFCTPFLLVSLNEA